MYKNKFFLKGSHWFCSVHFQFSDNQECRKVWKSEGASSNLLPLVEIGSTNLPKSGACPLLPTPLLLERNWSFIFPVFVAFDMNFLPHRLNELNIPLAIDQSKKALFNFNRWKYFIEPFWWEKNKIWKLLLQNFNDWKKKIFHYSSWNATEERP